MSSLLERIPIPIAVFEASRRRLVFANAAWRKACSSAHVLHDDDLPLYQQVLDQAVTEGEHSSVAARLRGSDGAWHWCHLQLAKPESALDPWLCIATHLGESETAPDQPLQRQLYSEMLSLEREARARAERESRLKDEILRSVSHELRTPLMTMLLWEKVLREDTTDHELRERALDAIHESTLVQSRLIGDLVDVARGVSGKLFVDLRPAELGEIVMDCITQATSRAADKQVSVTYEREHGLDIQADDRRMRQIVQNVLWNAIHRAEPGGSVPVSARRLGPSIVVTIAHDGKGYAPSELSHVFEPFRQEDEQHDKSLGLELAIARQLVVLHGGTLTAASDGPEAGAIFTITVPAVRRTPIPTQRVSRSKPAALDGIRVLVIDDDPRVRDALVRLIGRAGAIVDSAESANSGRVAIARDVPDVLVCDIEMPDEDGYSFVRWIRRLGGEAHETPAIALTAFAAIDDSQRAYDAGFDLHLTKPIEIARLITNIHELVMLRRTGART